MEFTIIMRDFILPDRLLNLESIISMMTALSSSEEVENQINKLQNSLAEVDKNPPAIVPSACVPKGARDIFIDICQNVIFNNDIDARDYVEKLNASASANAVWRHFHEYGMAVYTALMEVDQFIHSANIYPRPQRTCLCIYCKSTNAEFRTAEHVAPETLGNERSILPRGYVCTPCNTTFSKIENTFLNTLPMEFIQFRVINVNKDGRLPSVRYEKIHYTKTSPNTVTSISYAGPSSCLIPTKLSDGTFRIDAPEIKSKFNHTTCARTLFKMALGAITIEQGRAVSLQSRYDPARNFALNGGAFPNWLIVGKKINIHPKAYVQWKQMKPFGTILFTEIFGVQFITGLEPVPASASPPDVPKAEEYLFFDLRTPNSDI